MTRSPRLIAAALLLAVLPAATVLAQRVNPKPVVMRSPDYPTALTDSGRDGTVTVEFAVEVDGTIHDPVVKSSDDPAFTEAALAALPKWKFEPGTRDGQPVRMKVALPFQFAAPPEQKVNAAFGRKVYLSNPPPADQIVTAEQYGYPLEPLNQPNIRYPAAFQGSGREERVEVGFLVTPEGRTADPAVLNEVPPEFAATAIMYVGALVYEFPVKDGKPVYVALRRGILIADGGERAAKSATP